MSSHIFSINYNQTYKRFVQYLYSMFTLHKNNLSITNHKITKDFIDLSNFLNLIITELKSINKKYKFITFKSDLRKRAMCPR